MLAILETQSSPYYIETHSMEPFELAVGTQSRCGTAPLSQPLPSKRTRIGVSRTLSHNTRRYSPTHNVGHPNNHLQMAHVTSTLQHSECNCRYPQGGSISSLCTNWWSCMTDTPNVRNCHIRLLPVRTSDGHH